jgi:RNA-directed DNA polymerase
VQVLHGEGVANHTVPESCAVGREARREALTGVRAGGPSSRERQSNRVPTPFRARKATRAGALSQAPDRPGVVEEPGMPVRSSFGNREISSPASGREADWSAAGRR